MEDGHVECSVYDRHRLSIADQQIDGRDMMRHASAREHRRTGVESNGHDRERQFRKIEPRAYAGDQDPVSHGELQAGDAANAG